MLNTKQIIILFFSGLTCLVFFNFLREYLPRLNKKMRQEIEEDELNNTETELQNIINNKYLETIQPDIKVWEYEGNKIELFHKLSFNSTEHGLIQGYFLGLKETPIEGYSYHIFIRQPNIDTSIDNRQDSICSIPVEYIEKNTLTVWR